MKISRLSASMQSSGNFQFLAGMSGVHICLFLIIGFIHHNEAYAQNITRYDLFQLKDSELYWQNAYGYSGPQEDLRPLVVQMLKSRFFTFNVVRNESGYTGEIRHYQIDCKAYGRTYLNTPRMYWDGEWTGKFKLEVLENQYNVTIYALYYEKMEHSVDYYRTEKLVKGRFVDAVARKNKKSLRKNEFSNLALMSLSLKDNFDIQKATVIP